MTHPLPHSEVGRTLFDRWRCAPDTTQEHATLATAVLRAIETDGWPPVTPDDHTTPRWPSMQDPFTPDLKIVACAADLWIVVRMNPDSFDFVTAHHPTPDDAAHTPWLPDS